jgi:multicomponent Na+:H+ antiporter subunit B
MRKRFKKWVMGRTDVMDRILDDASEIYDQPRETIKKQRMELVREMEERPGYERTLEAEQKGFYLIYHIVAVISCILLIGVLLYTVAMLPRYGEENVRADEVVERYVEHGLEETGAVNIVSGMILDYRAFDTLGESHVLFTALICVMILLRVDHKNMRSEYEDYYTVLSDRYYSLERDTIIRTMGKILLPCIFVYGIYILLNGQNSPGGGFSGGAVMGTGLIITAAAFGFDRVDSFLPLRVSMWMTFLSLMFYSFAKGYVFFTGANGLENHIPKGVPGAILSGGLILPLDIAVGLVVAGTMFGFYSLIRRGNIGGA